SHPHIKRIICSLYIRYLDNLFLPAYFILALFTAIFCCEIYAVELKENIIGFAYRRIGGKKMDLKDLLNGVSTALNGKSIAGLLSKQALINNGKGTEVKDILGWNCIVRAEDGTCFSFYVAQPPKIGMTKPVQIPCPLGIRIIPSYKIGIEEAIKILNERDCGDTFVDVNLYWPLVPDCNEPYWHFRLTLGNEVFIGANTGTGGCHKFKELLMQG
ncbi:MAG: hypothetical protein RBT65_16245, partial [Methanolobus sp.]|nr:hypothetical protein [Methanolobus sp.]